MKLSHRYIPARQLPDKAVSLLDTACARVAVSLHATPAEVDDCRKRIEALQTELGIIGRERAIGIDVGSRASAADARLTEETARLNALEARWLAERALVDELLDLRAKLRGGLQPVEGTGSRLEAAADASVLAPAAGTETEAPTEAQRDAWRAQLQSVQLRLSEVQGESPLILPTVDYQAVATVVGDWTGIPVGRMARKRDRHGAQDRHAARPARDRARPRDGDDRQAHPDLACRAGQSQQTPSASSCSRVPRAWARPRLHSRWPRPCTAASRTSSPST